MDKVERFSERLREKFDGRLRARWSVEKQAVEIEQRVGRKIDIPANETDDERIRVRDGYALIMTVQPGDRMRCKKCNGELKVPVFEFRMVTCEFCRMLGYYSKYGVGFFELNDRLIEYLEKHDPNNRAADEVERANKQLELAQQRELANTLESAVDDDFYRIAGIPRVGYTGKEQMWQKE